MRRKKSIHRTPRHNNVIHGPDPADLGTPSGPSPRVLAVRVSRAMDPSFHMVSCDIYASVSLTRRRRDVPAGPRLHDR